MRNKHLPMIGLMLFFGCSLVFAQPKADGAPTTLIKGGFVKTAPQWSPTGDKIALSTVGYDGIWVADANGKNLEKITSDVGSGYKLSWSEDGKTILARTSPKVDLRVFNEIKTYDVTNKTEKTLLPRTRALKGMPSWSSNNADVKYTLDSESKTVSSGKTALRSAKNISQAQILVKKMQEAPATIANEVDGLKELSGYILFNAQASSSNKVVFSAGGKGLFICNGDGTNLKHLGKGSTPTWMPDGKYVIASITKDDGYIVTEGILYSINIETGEYQKLTDESVVALRPAISPTGDKIAFEEIPSGDIYVLKLKK